MKLTDFLQNTKLDHSLLIGYYGGGNYGDELLLEVISNMLAREGTSDLAVTYQRPQTYPSMHHDFGFKLVDIHNRRAVLSAALKSRNILIGGGGLWGVDMNFNTLLLSAFLFTNRWVLGKKIYLLGVGYYGSTTRLGRLAAWLAGKSANLIFARDDESLAKFGRISKHVHLDSDIAWNIPTLDLAEYQTEVQQMQEHLPIGDKTLMVALRRPQAKRQSQDFVRFNKMIHWLIRSNPDRPIILVMLESEAKDQAMYREVRSRRRRHRHLRIIEAPYNPLTLFLYIKQNRKRLAIVAPQLHLIMTAHLCGVPFLPITYDNKVSQLMDRIGVPAKKRHKLAGLTADDLQGFADSFFGGSNG